MKERTHIDLFSGIGGFALAARNCGVRTIAFCEIEKYAQQVIIENFGAVIADADGGESSHVEKIEGKRVLQPSRCSASDAKRERASKSSRKENIYQTERRFCIAKERNGENIRSETDGCRPILYSDIRKLDGHQFAATWLLTAGFPCQPFSVAGKRAGAADDRYLWPELLRVIGESRPSHIILENVAGLLSILEPDSISEMESQEVELFLSGETDKAGETVTRIHRRIIGLIIGQLEEIGYDFPRLADGTPIILCIPACAVGAQHRRDRIWIVGHAKHDGQPEDAADPNESRCVQQRRAESEPKKHAAAECGSRRKSESAICGMADGVSKKLDRLDKERQTHNLMGYGKTTNTRRSKKLPSLREADGTEKISEQSGRQGRFQKEKVLRSNLHGKSLHKRASGKGSALQDGEKIPWGKMRDLRDENKPSNPSQRLESKKQYFNEPDDIVRFLSHKMALDKWQEAVEQKIGIKNLSVALESLGYYSSDVKSLRLLWKELDKDEKQWSSNCIFEGSVFHSEWPFVPRVTKGEKKRRQKLKALGNAIVHQVVQEIIQAMILCEQ